MRKRLSPRTILSLKPGKNDIAHGDVVMDDITPNLGVRILGTPQRPTRTFVYVGRFPGKQSSSRAALAPFVFDPDHEQVAAASLKRARAKANTWRAIIEEGRDPRVDEQRQREAEIRKQAVTFGAVCEDFIEQKLPGERRGKDVESDLRREFLPRWKTLPISDITDEEIIRIVRAKAKTAPAQARNLLGHARRLFQWAVDQRTYGLKTSPAAGIKPVAIVGKKIARDRVLTDEELFAFLRAATRMPYPAGPAYLILAMTGCRLAEVAEARWSEFSPAVQRAIRGPRPVDWSRFTSEDLFWTIPAIRMKGQEGSARAHTVPLTPAMLAILESLPVFAGGEFLFSRNAGRSAAIMSTQIKDQLDATMQRTLRAIARQRGDEDSVVELDAWRNHDLRRVVRSGLSRLKVPTEVAEAVLAHARPGIVGIYDRHHYYAEKLDALQRWHAHLRSIAQPAPMAPNIVALRG